MADYDVIVIGAGTGGLSAGAQLAAQGRKTLVLEQGPRVGGCCSTFEREGFHFDLGASLIESPGLINMAFEQLGTTLKDEVDLIACDPIYTLALKDGTRIPRPLAVDAAAEEIRKIAPDEVSNWYAYIDYMKGFLNAAHEFFLSPTLTANDMARFFINSPEMLKYAPLFACSYQDVIKRFFKDPRVRESLSYQTFFVGLPPELAPGLFAVIPVGEHDGLFYSKGGMIGIPEALRRCGEKAGMELQLNTLVKRVLVRDRRAMGVVLADGAEITADIVVSDVNAKMLYLDLIGEEHLPWLARVGIKSYEYAMSIPMLYLGVDYEPPLASHHTLATVPMEDMNDFWWQTYVPRHFKPDEQFGIISWTSHSDPSLAPEDHHVIVLTLTPAPYHRADGRSWDEIKPEITEQIIAYYDKHYIPGLASHVKVAELATPWDFERNLKTPQGAIYALRQDVTNEAIFRPAARSKSIKGLYLVGASTHPGGGVPTTIASGMIATRLIETYE
ncbi:MAG: NAD(P)/FAD-dependent oxidoreductase [Anaerolineae bacterium]|nr:NAD(P)/FAD-dependent oxidoreductase [Anaerolineae bacterium]